MMLVALLMRPWMMQMDSVGMIPRILADDLFIFSSGEEHLERLEHAFDLTHEHMEDMGAKIAPSKSMTIASDVTSRTWLRNHTWRRLGRKVPVMTDMRDLGGHLNTAANRAYGKTLTTRMRNTVDSLRVLRHKKAPYRAKTEILRAKQLPRALYGCETAPVNEGVLKSSNRL